MFARSWFHPDSPLLINSNYSPFSPSVITQVPYHIILSSVFAINLRKVEEPQIRICMHFLSRTVCRRLLLWCFIGFIEKLTIIESWRPWLRWSRSELRWDWQETLPLPYRDRHFSSVVLYTFIVETILLNEGNVHKLGTNSAGTDKKLPFLERQTFFIWSTPTPSCWNHSSWMKEILHKLHLQKNFTTFSCFFYLWWSDILFQIIYSFTRNRNEQIERPPCYTETWTNREAEWLSLAVSILLVRSFIVTVPIFSIQYLKVSW